MEPEEKDRNECSENKVNGNSVDNENEWAEPCADCEIRSKLDDCKNGCELLEKSSIKNEPVFNWIDIDCLHPDPSQPRKTFDEESLKGLAGTIKSQGILQPILVDNDNMIVLGERRWRAAKIAGIGKVPVIVRHTADAFLSQLIADAHNEEIPILERAKAWQAIKDQQKLTYEELSDLLKVSKSTAFRTLCLANLPKPMAKALEEGSITMTKIVEIRQLPEEQQMDAFIEETTEEEKGKPPKLHLNTSHRPKDMFRKLGVDNVHQNVVIASNHETMKHFVVKAMVYKILRQMDRITVCEMEAGSGVVDIYDAQTGYAYEVETKPGPRTGKEKAEQFSGQVKDVLIIDLNKVPNDIERIEEHLKTLVV